MPAVDPERVSVEVATAGARTATSWRNKKLTLAGLYELCGNVWVDPTTWAEYRALPQAERDRKKDVGGFVGGPLSVDGGRRKSGSVRERHLVTLDMDAMPPSGPREVEERMRERGWEGFVYSTRNHTERNPRIRVLLPMDRPCTPDEYVPLARAAARELGIGWCDPSTYQVERLMYWPTCCSDMPCIAERVEGASLLPVDSLLSSLGDWRDASTWPTAPGEEAEIRRMVGQKQADPLTKKGPVGDFCRAYDIPAAISAFLPSIYERCEGKGDRYTYAPGTTYAGAVVYGDGRFLYSNHGTDPAGRQLVNSYDLVRIHLYGDADGGDPKHAKSTEAMNRLVREDGRVQALKAETAARELGEAIFADEDAAEGAPPPELPGNAPEGESARDMSWAEKLARNEKTGAIEVTIDNVLLILGNDPRLKGRLSRDTFAGVEQVGGRLPWDQPGGAYPRRWTDADDSGIRWYLEKTYGMPPKVKSIDDGVVRAFQASARDPLRAFVLSLRWDGIPRLDRALVDALGADDTEYVRTVTRKTFCGAVKRALEPGCKFDTMLVLIGDQGGGKSAFCRMMAVKPEWFVDSVESFEGKELYEKIQGKWICELAELMALSKSDNRRIKALITSQEDTYREAYARRAEVHPRRCILIGTSNQRYILGDMTGNRRFWPVDLHGTQADAVERLSILTPEYVTQLWAEAKVRLEEGEKLYLEADMLEAAAGVQEEHRDVDSTEGIVRAFMDRDIPSDWQSWDADRRRLFWGGGMASEEIELVQRRRICALEVLNECPGLGNAKDPAMKRAVRDILSRTPGWRACGTYRPGPRDYGTQRGYERIG